LFSNKDFKAMKNPMEVLRNKEQELLRVKKEVDALQVVLRLLSDGEPRIASVRPDRHAEVELS
jgi:hypothetical protein